MKRGTKLYELLDEEIRNSDLFRTAITHRSVGSHNNERLEFLGDSILSISITEYLYRNMPDAPEGDLSRLRSHLVRGETLADIGVDNFLGDQLKLGPGELKSGGFRRRSIIEDALEAIIGAVFLLKGFEFTRQFIYDLFGDKLIDLPSAQSLKDPKSQLQEWLQSQGHPVPEYEVLSTAGKAHQMIFNTVCGIPALSIVCENSGSSRRKAEQGAAVMAMQQAIASND